MKEWNIYRVQWKKHIFGIFELTQNFEIILTRPQFDFVFGNDSRRRKEVALFIFLNAV